MISAAFEDVAMKSDYCSQMSSEAKIFNPTTKREEWAEIVKNNNHLWDCEAIQAAAAWRLGCGMPDPGTPVETPFAQPPSTTESGWVNAHTGQY